ncbi:hypothetical protein [Gymnodinialimonas sp. 57CJ19]|uniref:hypothetical protein n=1 Tax=Gymnodinialimonas sp. 57CJ19 TaxID=3138498 RepID=UPI00313454BE
MNNSAGAECRKWTWGIAIVTGIVLWLVLWGLGDWSFFAGLLLGVLCAVILGALLTWMMCREQVGSGQGAGAATASAASAPAPAPSPTPTPTVAPAAAVEPVAEPEATHPVVEEVAAAAEEAEETALRASEDAAAAEAELAHAEQIELDRAADAATEQTEAALGEADRAAEAAAVAQAEADAAARVEAQATAEANAASDAAETIAAAPPPAEMEGTRPAALDGPRGGTADDLKRIKGVGPKMEQMCNALGFYHFDQIAAWTPDEVRWVDQNLKGFKGRVTRDAWVEQAALLASGQETEFSKKVDDGNVY